MTDRIREEIELMVLDYNAELEDDEVLDYNAEQLDGEEPILLDSEEPMTVDEMKGILKINTKGAAK